MMDFNSSSSISGQVSALIDAGLQKRQANNVREVISVHRA